MSIERPSSGAARFLPASFCLAVAWGCATDSPHPESGEGAPAAAETTWTDSVRQASEASDSRPVVVFLGNSLTAGLGVDAGEAFPAVVQRRIEDAGLGFRVLNAGISGETTAGGMRRIAEIAEREPAVVVIALGGNDALRGVPPSRVRQNLAAIAREVRTRAPDARLVIAGMRAPPNMGDAYTDSFRRIFAEVATEYEAVLIPFLLEGVAANSELNQPDGIHPTAEGHRAMAEIVWDALEPVLREVADRPGG